MKVAEEREPGVHTTKVVVEVPAGFTIKSCEANPAWSSTPSIATPKRRASLSPPGR
jgi:uncharacterized protein YcnI